LAGPTVSTRPSACGTAPTAIGAIYAVSLHDALPICQLAAQHGEARAAHLGRGLSVQPAVRHAQVHVVADLEVEPARLPPAVDLEDRKSTRLNSSHVKISYAVFCLKKKHDRHNRWRHE